MGFRFYGSIPPSFKNLYIFLGVDYVSKWIEAIATSKNDTKTVVNFSHKNILTRFGAPRCILSDEGNHFCNKAASLLDKYCVKHAEGLPYHLQSNGQAKISNCELNNILEKTVNMSRKDWSQKLDDAL